MVFLTIYLRHVNNVLCRKTVSAFIFKACRTVIIQNALVRGICSSTRWPNNIRKIARFDVPDGRSFVCNHAVYSRDSPPISKEVDYSTNTEDNSHIAVALADTARSILASASKQDKMVASAGLVKIQKMVTFLHDIGVGKSEMMDLFTVAPDLLKQPKFLSVTNCLLNYGFTPTQIVGMYKLEPNITGLTENRIVSTLESLRSIGFYDRTLLIVVSTCPAIITLDIGVVTGRVNDLKYLFKTNDVIMLIVKSPNILFENWSVLREMFDYVHHTMGISQRQIMYSNLFTYPLIHVQSRHMFLVRSGYFTKTRRKGEIDQNPRLQKIIDTSDSSFAKQFGGMTTLDYTVFSQILKNEIEQGLVEFDVDIEESDEAE